jgi:hypothetical protein
VGFRLEFSVQGVAKVVEDDRTISYPERVVVKSEKNKDSSFQQPLQYKVTRATFEAFEVDYDDILLQPVMDSVLHLTVVPYSKPIKLRCADNTLNTKSLSKN